MKQWVFAIIIAAVLLGGALMFFFGRPQDKYQNVSVSEAESLIRAGSVTVIDVREPFEYAQGHIPGAQLIPLGAIEGKLASLNPESSYLLVCRSGNRSAQAARILVSRGFEDVRNMSGGMLAWRGPIER